MSKRSTQSRRNALKLIGGAGLAGLAGCMGGGDGTDGSGGDGGGGGDGGDGGSTTASDGLEDEMTIYTTTDYEPVLAAFEEEYGVTVNQSVYTGPQVTSRFTSEAQSGELQADASIQSLQSLTWESVAPYLAEVEIGNPDSVLTEDRRNVLEERDAYGKGWPIIILPFGAPYNTQNVDGPPETWDGFLDSKWENRVATSTTSMRGLYLLRRKRGDSEDEALSYLQGLDENISEYTPAAPPTVQAIIGGQYDLGCHLATHFVRQGVDQGAPIDVMYPPYTLEHHNGVGVTVDDQNDAPNLSREFATWVTSERGQEAIQDELQFKPAIPEMDHGHPHMQQRLEEYDPEMVPVLYSQQEARDADALLSENIDRLDMA